VFLDDCKYPVFTSNHDTERLIDLLERETDRSLIFLEKISKLSHPVVLYYGDEVGLGGVTDRASCLPMNWNKNAIWQKV